MSALVELQNLSIRTSERPLVEGVDVTVFPERVTALCGPSGSGKSLTARAIMGVIPENLTLVSGQLRYPVNSGDKDWFLDARSNNRLKLLLSKTAPLRGAYFTYSPQSAASALNPGRTIGMQLSLAISRRSSAVSNMADEIKKVLSAVELPVRAASALPSELSGGMCQRAALAIAVAPNPKLVIADEPETGLDPILRRSVIELLIRVTKEFRSGLLLISHHEDSVERIADEVVRLRPIGVQL